MPILVWVILLLTLFSDHFLKSIPACPPPCPATANLQAACPIHSKRTRSWTSQFGNFHTVLGSLECCGAQWLKPGEGGGGGGRSHLLKWRITDRCVCLHQSSLPPYFPPSIFQLQQQDNSLPTSNFPGCFWILSCGIYVQMSALPRVVFNPWFEFPHDW